MCSSVRGSAFAYRDRLPTLSTATALVVDSTPYRPRPLYRKRSFTTLPSGVTVKRREDAEREAAGCVFHAAGKMHRPSGRQPQILA